MDFKGLTSSNLDLGKAPATPRPINVWEQNSEFDDVETEEIDFTPANDFEKLVYSCFQVATDKRSEC